MVILASFVVPSSSQEVHVHDYICKSLILTLKLWPLFKPLLFSQVHTYSSTAAKISANEKCCGLERISNGLSCCNFVGYNPGTQYCADISHQETG